jgi:hypothetical protein
VVMGFTTTYTISAYHNCCESDWLSQKEAILEKFQQSDLSDSDLVITQVKDLKVSLVKQTNKKSTYRSYIYVLYSYCIYISRIYIVERIQISYFLALSRVARFYATTEQKLIHSF